MRTILDLVTRSCGGRRNVVAQRRRIDTSVCREIAGSPQEAGEVVV